jgi:hypothetical protein
MDTSSTYVDIVSAEDSVPNVESPLHPVKYRYVDAI